MIRATNIIFCDGDHIGWDVTFPPVGFVDADDFLQPPDIDELLRRSRGAGWRRLAGRDYCEKCVKGLKALGVVPADH